MCLTFTAVDFLIEISTARGLVVVDLKWVLCLPSETSFSPLFSLCMSFLSYSHLSGQLQSDVCSAGMRNFLSLCCTMCCQNMGKQWCLPCSIHISYLLAVWHWGQCERRCPYRHFLTQQKDWAVIVLRAHGISFTADNVESEHQEQQGSDDRMSISTMLWGTGRLKAVVRLL